MGNFILFGGSLFCAFVGRQMLKTPPPKDSDTSVNAFCADIVAPVIGNIGFLIGILGVFIFGLKLILNLLGIKII